MQKMTFGSTLLLAILLVAGCKSSGPRVDAGPQPKAANSVFSMVVHKVHTKGGDNVRVWITLENKTESELTVSYGDFYLEHEDKRYPGALRVPFVRVDKAFPMVPKMVKRFSGPLEFLGVPLRGKAKLVLPKYIEGGASKRTDLAVDVVLTDAEWKRLLDSTDRPDVPAWLKPIIASGGLKAPDLEED